MTILKVADILRESIVDGKGMRAVVFFQGCPRHCRGCHNEQLLPFEGGREYTPEALSAEILQLLTPLHRGVTFSGGDPLAQPEGLYATTSLLRKARPDLNIWLYTGYLFEEVMHFPVVADIDVIVDGPFVLEQRDISLPFKGSGNQRIIDVKASLAARKVLEAEL
ncbi:MAG: anaerobic ribonucleoside-triphosphate reductase activating protein [Acidaminococcaceae bacterium]|nr:anaerobic ribonucleoside-triphosphate reductase activating protein [Acidaminococcaceae bacterium]